MSNLSKILELAKPTIDEMVSNFIDWWNKNQKRGLSEYDIESYRFNITIDLLKAIGKYITDTDIVSNEHISKRKGSVVLSCWVERDGKNHYFETERIIAEGAIQRRHYRYISKTTLRSLETHPLVQKAVDTQRTLSKLEKALKDKEITDSNYKINSEMYDKELVKTDAEILTKHHFDNYAWENLNDSAKKSYKTKEEFDVYVADEKEKCLSNHKNNYTVSKKRLDTDYQKYSRKLEAKIEELSKEVKKSPIEFAPNLK